MAKITKEEAIEIGNRIMEKVLYRLDAIRYVSNENGDNNLYSSIIYLRLNKDRNPQMVDPNTTHIIVDAETGEAHIIRTL
jgi:hypothetical protein